MRLSQSITTKIGILLCLAVSVGNNLCVVQITASQVSAGNAVRGNADRFEISTFPSNDQGQPDENNTAAGAGGWRV